MAQTKFKEKFKKMNKVQLEAELPVQIANLTKDGSLAVEKIDYIKELLAKKK